MLRLAKNTVRHLVRSLGYDIIDYRPDRTPPVPQYPHDFSKGDIELIEWAGAYTMTGPVRLLSMIRAAEYIARCDIPGAVVECGVWRGGSMMVAARTLMRHEAADRALYLYDTFEGMTEPTDKDVRCTGEIARERFDRLKTGVDRSDWCRASLEDVQAAMRLTDYDEQRIHYVQGKVEETIPSVAPDRIALLRLDTDWYASTRHELTYLFPRLVTGGVLIIDDYGAWMGQKQAFDEYMREHHIRLFLQRIDPFARMAVKV